MSRNVLHTAKQENIQEFELQIIEAVNFADIDGHSTGLVIHVFINISLGYSELDPVNAHQTLLKMIRGDLKASYYIGRW